MFTEDYILRIINQAVRAFLKIAGLKKDGDYQEAQQVIDQALEQLLGMRAEIIKQMDDESLLRALTQQGRLDIDRLALIADLFKEEGDILAAQNQISESRKSYLRSLVYHLETGFGETTRPSGDLTEEIEGLVQNLDNQNPLETGFGETAGTSFDLTEKIEALVQKLDIQNLPDDTLWSLFSYFERIGAFPKADDVILKLADRPDLYANIQPELVAFYERLLEKPIGELVEAGMSREEVKGKLEKTKQSNSKK
jgi:tetratricopeptide (TPR) repeat protein